MYVQSQKPAPFLFFITVAVSLFMFVPVIISVMAGLVNNYRTGLKSGRSLVGLRLNGQYIRIAGFGMCCLYAGARRALCLCPGTQPITL